MNILSVGGRYKPTNGGNAKRISTMCENYHQLGNKVIVMTCDSVNHGGKIEIIEGVKVYRYKKCDDLVNDIAAILSKEKIDIVLVHEETYLRKLRWKKINLPIVYECHAIEKNSNRIKELIVRLIRKLYFQESYLKRIFVLSQNAKKLLLSFISYPEGRIVYTPNGVENKAIKETETYFADKNKFIYGYAGTLYDFQGINILLGCAKDILDIAEDIQIYIVGGGPLEKKVNEFVSNNGLEKRIILTGSVSQMEFDKYIQKFDVMVMPRPSLLSTESAVPLKIFDAAYHRKPVVMSNVSGLTEAFSESAALIYDAKKPKEFVECCRKIYRNKQLAERLVQGEIEALRNWPSVMDVAKIQLESMQEVVNEVSRQ